MTEEEFIRLGAHLEQLDPVIGEFCERHGFERIRGASVGRYPRVRLQRCGHITIWIDLWMCLDDAGQRFTQFFPDIPYELGAGAFFDDRSEERGQCRYQKEFVILSSIPFNEVADVLSESLQDGVRTLEKWDSNFLRREGLRVPLY